MSAEPFFIGRYIWWRHRNGIHVDSISGSMAKINYNGERIINTGREIYFESGLVRYTLNFYANEIRSDKPQPLINNW